MSLLSFGCRTLSIMGGVLCILHPTWELVAGMAATLRGPFQMLLGSLGRLRAAWGCRRYRLCLSHPSGRGSSGASLACWAVCGSRSTWSGGIVRLTVGMRDACFCDGAGVSGKSRWGLSCKKIASSFLWGSGPCDFQKGECSVMQGN